MIQIFYVYLQCNYKLDLGKILIGIILQKIPNSGSAYIKGFSRQIETD